MVRCFNSKTLHPIASTALGRSSFPTYANECWSSGPNCTSRFHMYSRWQPQPSDPYQINCQPETFPPKSQPLDILSLIRKFEDVCLQANAKSSEQSPIKKPQSLHGRKAQVGTFQDRNTAIVGPTKENRSGFGGVISEGKAISWQRDIRAPFYRSGEGVKLHDAGRVYQTHIPYGACSLPYSVCVSGLKKSIHAPHSTVKDKIRFYEAFAGNEITLCKPHL